MLWIVGPTLLFAGLAILLAGLAILAYLLWRKIPIKGGSLTLSDVINLVALGIALGSSGVAIVTYQQSVKDSEEQQKSLDESRTQLQAVVETAKAQQQVLTQHLETSKTQLSIQQEVLMRERERASRKPKLYVFIEDKSFSPKKMTTGLAVDKDTRTRLPIRNKVQRGSQWVLFCTPS